MTLYKKYPAYQIFLRRTLVIVAGVVTLPVMLAWKDFIATCIVYG